MENIFSGTKFQGQTLKGAKERDAAKKANREEYKTLDDRYTAIRKEADNKGFKTKDEYDKKSDEMKSIRAKMMILDKEFELLQSDDISSINSFADQSTESDVFKPNALPDSLGDMVGRKPVDANRVHIPYEVPNDQTRAEEVAEGEEGTSVKLTDSLRTVQTDSENKVILNDTITVGMGALQDDPKTLNAAQNNAHRRHMILAENFRAFSTMMKTKPGKVLNAFRLDRNINYFMSGEYKKRLVIITNKPGFSALDECDANGNPLLRRDEKGRFIYRNKYEVLEFINASFPETDDHGCLIDPTAIGGAEGSLYAPVFVGDFAAALRFFPIRDVTTTYEKWTDENGNFLQPQNCDRHIREEIITVTTSSDNVWFWGGVNCSSYTLPEEYTDYTERVNTSEKPFVSQRYPLSDAPEAGTTDGEEIQPSDEVENPEMNPDDIMAYSIEDEEADPQAKNASDDEDAATGEEIQPSEGDQSEAPEVDIPDGE